MGLILRDDTIVELRNLSNTPRMTLIVAREELSRYLPEAVAMWHTHPLNNANLSVTDYGLFQSLPTLRHFIVTATRVRSFVVHGREVMLDEADCV